MWPAWMTPPPGEETAPKKYLREAEDRDCHGVALSPQPPDAGHRPSPHTGGQVGLHTPQPHLMLTLMRSVAFASHLDKPLILFNLFNFNFLFFWHRAIHRYLIWLLLYFLLFALFICPL